MTARLYAALLVTVLLGALSLHSAGTSAQQPVGARTIVALSDLHMGVGRATSGAWHPYEDFRWSDDLTAFLKAVDAEGRSAVDLVFNGDTLELTESMLEDCIHAAALGCTEPEALARLERVLVAHAAEIEALRQFARSGSNRVVFVPGDRDAALLFPALARRLIGALQAPASRIDVAGSGYWLSTDGQVYAEHGHQIGFSADKVEKWPSPVVRAEGREHLVRSWGGYLLGTFQKQYEEQYPVIDNVAAAGVGVKYVLAAEGVTDLGEAAPRLLRYLLFAMSWQQFRMDLDGGDVEPPAWDVPKTRAEGAVFLVSALADDDPFKLLAAKALADGRLATSLDELTDDEIVAICDYRAAVRRARRRMERIVTQFPARGPALAECPRTSDTRGSAFEYFWRSRDQVFTRQIEAASRRVPNPARPIAVFVHGHTHLPDRSQSGMNAINGEYTLVPEGFSPVRRAFSPVAINGGAWQRTVTPVQLEQLKADRGLSDGDLLRSLQPEQLPPCYSFVQILPYTDTPAPRVRYWSRSAAGEWRLAAGCGE